MGQGVSRRSAFGAATAQETAEVMNRQKRGQRYLSYLLRLWQTGDGEEQVWRASLQVPGSEERHGFATFQGLVDFLQTQTEQKGRAAVGAPRGKTQPEGG